MPCGRSSRNTVRVWKVFAVAGAKGTPREWLYETAVACRVIYDWQRADGTYGKQFVTDTYLLPERQLILASYRLAAVLNDLFG